MRAVLRLRSRSVLTDVIFDELLKNFVISTPGPRCSLKALCKRHIRPALSGSHQEENWLAFIPAWTATMLRQKGVDIKTAQSCSVMQ